MGVRVRVRRRTHCERVGAATAGERERLVHSDGPLAGDARAEAHAHRRVQRRRPPHVARRRLRWTHTVMQMLCNERSGSRPLGYDYRI